MKNLLLTLSLFINFYTSSQKAGIDLTFNAPSYQFSNQFKPGVGFDANIYLPIKSSYLELTPWSFFIINPDRSDIISGDRYSFAGSGIGYFQNIDKWDEWFVGAVGRAGFSEQSHKADFLFGAEIVNIQQKTPLKLGIGGFYSSLSREVVFSLSLGYIIK